MQAGHDLARCCFAQHLCIVWTARLYSDFWSLVGAICQPAASQSGAGPPGICWSAACRLARWGSEIPPIAIWPWAIECVSSPHPASLHAADQQRAPSSWDTPYLASLRRQANTALASAWTPLSVCYCQVEGPLKPCCRWQPVYIACWGAVLFSCLRRQLQSPSPHVSATGSPADDAAGSSLGSPCAHRLALTGICAPTSWLLCRWFTVNELLDDDSLPEGCLGTTHLLTSICVPPMMATQYFWSYKVLPSSFCVAGPVSRMLCMHPAHVQSIATIVKGTDHSLYSVENENIAMMLR